MVDSYTEVTSTSWGSRIGGSLKGIFFGFILFIVAFPLLFWNEGRTVERYKSLVEGAGLVITVPDSEVDPGNNGKLIHITGLATTTDTLADPTFGINAANAIKLRRKVEMYQWQEESHSETEKKVGGGTETTTTYTYHKGWSSSLVNSSNFKKRAGHENPSSMPYRSNTQSSNNVTIGAFKLSASQVDNIDEYATFDVSENPIPQGLGQAQKYHQGYYIGENPNAPSVGDVRVTFEIVRPTQISLVAEQFNGSFKAYQTKAGGIIDILTTGTYTSKELFEQEQATNTLISWVLRFVGLFIMFLGLNMILKPLSVIADVIPMIGNIVGAGTGLISFLIALVLSFLTIAIAWIFYRPLLAGALIAGSVVLLYLSQKKVKEAKPVMPPPAPSTASVNGNVPPPPPPGG